MALQDGAKLAVMLNGNPLEQISSIEMTTNSGQQRIDTMQGLAGFTPGSGDVSINLGFTVPIGGTEEEFQQKCATGEYVSMQIVVGSKNYVGTGKIMDVSISQSTGANTEGTLSWVGELDSLS